jgi:hypothetical protein
MRIDLVAGVPNEAILAEVEFEMERQAQFDDAKVRREVSRPEAEHAYQLVAHLVAELF